ncbi:C-C motif chemokine 20 [Symphorus nematophorus]
MAKLVLCVSIILVLLVAQGVSSPMVGCCTQYHESAVPVKVLKSYTIQRDDYCNIKAVIFKTVKKRFICADPDSEWVKRAMEFVPQKH